MSHYYTLDQGNPLDRELFESAILAAAQSPTPSYICDIQHDPALVPVWADEGRQRTKDNAERLAKAWRSQKQHIPGQAFTADEIGRVAEGPVELMLGLDVAAVLHGQVDARPDKTVDGVRFDVKGSENRPDNTFSLPVHKVAEGVYDALILVRYLKPGHVRVWSCKCEATAPAWSARPGVRGQTPFYVISCPDGALPRT
jgi:hypothetical protein